MPEALASSFKTSNISEVRESNSVSTDVPNLFEYPSVVITPVSLLGALLDTSVEFQWSNPSLVSGVALIPAAEAMIFASLVTASVASSLLSTSSDLAASMEVNCSVIHRLGLKERREHGRRIM